MRGLGAKEPITDIAERKDIGPYLKPKEIDLLPNHKDMYETGANLSRRSDLTALLW